MTKRIAPVLMAVVMTVSVSQAAADTGVSAVYEVSAEELWKTVDFHKPSEKIMPPIERSDRQGEGLGATKTNFLKGGGEVHLLLVYYAPKERAFNYTIQSSPLPVKNYVGEVRVSDAGEGKAKLTWHGTYDADGATEEEADQALGGFYNAIASRIGEMYTRVE